MANDITVSASLSATKNSQTVALAIGNRAFTMTGNIIADYIQSVGTSEEALPKGDVGTLGWALIYNMDATNYVQIQVGTGGAAFAKLKAGEFCLFRFGSGVTAPYAIANSSACRVRVILIED